MENIPMRVIKYRAWYKGDTIDEMRIPSMMCDVVGFEKISGNYDTIILHSNEFTGHGKLAVPIYSIISGYSDCALMQYTGRNDKNGTVIFLGRSTVGFPT